MRVAVAPSSLIFYETTRRQRLRGDLTYAYRHAKVSARSGALRVAAGSYSPAGWRIVGNVDR